MNYADLLIDFDLQTRVGELLTSRLCFADALISRQVGLHALGCNSVCCIYQIFAKMDTILLKMLPHMSYH